MIADASVNCGEAYGIGKKAADALTGKTFSEPIPRKSKVISFRSSKTNIKVRGQVVDINLQIFLIISLVS